MGRDRAHHQVLPLGVSFTEEAVGVAEKGVVEVDLAKQLGLFRVGHAPDQRVDGSKTAPEPFALLRHQIRGVLLELLFDLDQGTRTRYVLAEGFEDVRERAQASGQRHFLHRDHGRGIIDTPDCIIDTLDCLGALRARGRGTRRRGGRGRRTGVALRPLPFELLHDEVLRRHRRAMGQRQGQRFGHGDALPGQHPVGEIDGHGDVLRELDEDGLAVLGDLEHQVG
jgi:hypothetical protein